MSEGILHQGQGCANGCNAPFGVRCSVCNTENRAEQSGVFVLVCRECWPEATVHHLVGEIPFKSADARGLWASQHTRGTGHDSWIVIDA